MNHSRLISIAMATYNGEKYLHKQIDSILTQDYQNFELIIRDDCSTDSTKDILKQYLEKDKRIKVIFGEENLGFRKNFEIVIKQCSGDYIAFADQDDVWTEDHLSVLFDNIGTNECIGANAELVDCDLKSLGATTFTGNGMTIVPDKDLLRRHLVHSNCIQGAACMISKSIVHKIIPIPENIKWHDYWVALVASMNRGCVYTDRVILKYRQHGNNVTSNTKFTLVNRIKRISGGRKERINEHISLLTEVLKVSEEKEYRVFLKEVIGYYEKFLKHPIFVLNFYKSHYREIYLCDKGLKLYLLRVIKLFILKF